MDGKISVIMGIYNCEKTLEQAVAAIQAQTYDNWELILCDDASADGTFVLAEQLAREDRRIVLLKNEKNLGLGRTLNRCLERADGEFVARMDGDDDCSPERFARQTAFLREHPEFDIVSSAMTFFDESGTWGRKNVPEYPSAAAVATGSPICHAPVMLRRTCLEAVGGYSDEDATLRVEDVDLWIRLYAAGYRCYNIREPLYYMRNDQNAYARRRYRYRVNSTRVRLRGCRKLGLGPKCYLKALEPMVIGLIPGPVRRAIRKRRQRRKESGRAS